MPHEKLKKRGMLLLAVVWMALIFFMSAQVADDSGALSGSVTWYIIEGINWIFARDWDAATVLMYAKMWEYPIRKLAHMSEYAIFAWILVGNFALYGKTKSHRYIWAWAGAVCYAVTDEIHQLFVPGRAGLFSDVCVDGAGAFLGLLFMWGCKESIRCIHLRRYKG